MKREEFSPTKFQKWLKVKGSIKMGSDQCEEKNFLDKMLKIHKMNVYSIALEIGNFSQG